MTKNKLFLYIALVVTTILTTNAWADDGGNCGPVGQESDCTWSYNEATHTLTISGSGSGTIKDYSGYSDTPWKDYRTQATTVVVEDGITNIGKFAFHYMSNVTSLTMPDSLTTIGQGAFAGMSSVTGELKIPSGVTSIGASAFYDVSSVTGELKIPSGVTSIGNSAFNNMTGITSIIIPESVTAIGSNAFQHMPSLISITIPDSVTNINYQAFWSTSVQTLIANAENLQKYLNTGGSFKDGNIGIVCSTGDCQAVLEAWDTAHGTNYASRTTFRAKNQEIQNADGSTSIYRNGQLVGFRGKRIYTVEEAEKLSKPTGNTFRIRYK